MHLVERQTKRGSKTKARPSWTAYGTGSWMTWSRYRKKWSWYFINIAPLKLSDGETRPNEHSQFCYLLCEASKRESTRASVYLPRLKRGKLVADRKSVRSEIYFLRSLQFKYITNKRRWCEIFTERTFKYSFAWYLRSDLGKQWDKNASIDSSILPLLLLLLLLYHSKSHETIIDRIVAYTSKFYEKFDILRS